jgi:hypothetical protein
MVSDFVGTEHSVQLYIDNFGRTGGFGLMDSE